MNLNKNVKQQLPIAITVNIAHILNGYSLSWTVPVVPKLQDINQTPLSEVVEVTQASWIASSIYIGVFIAPVASGWFSNLIGRRATLTLGGVIISIAYLILIFAHNYTMICVGRAISGISTGLIAVVSAFYVGEMASKEIRGIILASIGVFHALGTLFIFSVGPFVSYAVIGYIALLLCCFFVIGCLYIPESPIFYVLKGDELKAKNVLRNLGRYEDADIELKAITEMVHETANDAPNWKTLLTVKSNRKALLITALLFIFQDCCGITVISYFLTTIFQIAGSSIDPVVATIIVGATKFIGTLIVPVFIEKIGRKPLLLTSISGCLLSMTVLALFFYLDMIKHPVVESIRWLPLVSFILQNACYSIGFHSIPHTIIGEVFRPGVRSIGSSIAATIGHLAGYIMVLTFGYIVEDVGAHAVFWIFAAINAAAFTFVHLAVPETKGMSLSEIEKMLGK